MSEHPDSAYPVKPGLAIPKNEVWFEFSHATGPGGQNVNKVATRATLCFQPAFSAVLTGSDQRLTLRRLANRIGADGVLRVTAGDARTQKGNMLRAELRFRELLAGALYRPKARLPTRPSRGSVERRLEDKRRRGMRKAERGGKCE
ncbi:MAG: aminoacyl-tRNA hydrolase [Planctomycetota bacterium]|jgi:ribosome-associated protein|nr:aminoacyl-tRNA hydrolase [Planctomycetota bacterium]